MTSTTVNYQLSLPLILLPASPALAALHATRVRVLHPTESAFLDSTHCIKCGSYCTGRTSKTRKLSQGGGRVMTRTCEACGFRHETPVDRGNARLFTRRAQVESGTDQKLPVAQPEDALPSPAHPSRSRPMKKTGLQEMLSRNREKEAKAREKKPGGLADFLSGL